jgi:predicted nucleic acid-binding protein
MARYLDANIFLRFLRKDHPTWSPACKQLFEDIEQDTIQVWTSGLVLSEVVFVLDRTYKVPRADIAANLMPLIQLRSLRLPSKKLYRRIFALYTTTNLSFVDCHNVALMESKGEHEIYSYDEWYKKIGTVTRLEP